MSREAGRLASVSPDRTTLVGKTFPPARYVLNPEDIGDYLPLAGETHPAFYSDEGARAEGYARRVVPPSFGPFVTVLGLLRAFDWHEDFLFDYSTGTAMFGEQELEYRRPLYFGETVIVRGSVRDVYEKRGRQVFDVVEVDFTVAGEDEGDIAILGMQSYLLFK